MIALRVSEPSLILDGARRICGAMVGWAITRRFIGSVGSKAGKGIDALPACFRVDAAEKRKPRCCGALLFVFPAAGSQAVVEILVLDTLGCSKDWLVWYCDTANWPLPLRR